jgi:nitrate reductase NapD
VNISSIIVQTHPDKSAALQGELADIPGVEIHAAKEDGTIVITVEDTPEQAPANTLMGVQNMQGVLSASMVYNYCDE